MITESAPKEVHCAKTASDKDGGKGRVVGIAAMADKKAGAEGSKAIAVIKQARALIGGTTMMAGDARIAVSHHRSP